MNKKPLCHYTELTLATVRFCPSGLNYTILRCHNL